MFALTVLGKTNRQTVKKKLSHIVNILKRNHSLFLNRLIINQ